MRTGATHHGLRLGPVLILAAVTGCGAGAFDNSAPLTALDNFRIVEDGAFYRSAQLYRTTFELIFERYGIRTVINLRGRNEDELWYRQEKAAAAAAGVHHLDIAWSAQRLPTRAELLALYDAYRAAEYPVLVHCEAGADRTGAAAAIWRMVMRNAPRGSAARELSPLYGHFRARYPAMDALIEIFRNDRDWIANEYPG